MATEEEQKNTVLALMWKKSLAEKKKNNKYNEHRGNYDAKKNSDNKDNSNTQ